MRDVAAAWWPLAASWLLMSAEQPAIAAVIARLPSPELNLAAWGGVVFPLALVVEAPIIMLLAASTELSRDRASYRALRRFTHRAGALLTAVHLVVAATPVFGLVVEGLLAVPPEVAQPARIGLVLLLPWTWSIASRRTGQGVLIRYGHSRWVGIGTAVRLTSAATVLAVGYVLDRVPGTAVGALALSAGVLTEAAFVAWRVRVVAREHLRHDDPEHPPLHGRAFWRFYLPLMAMPLVTLVIQPIGTAAIGRMPRVIDSLAVWPVLMGLLFVLQSVGLAFNEVVVALLDRPGSRRALWRFTLLMSAGVTAVLLALVLTPLSSLWFAGVSGLAPDLARMATGAVAIGLPIPACRALQSWYQGVLVNARRTAAITEAVVVFGIVCIGVLVVGVWRFEGAGLTYGVTGFALGRIAQTVWLAIRCRSAGA